MVKVFLALSITFFLSLVFYDVYRTQKDNILSQKTQVNPSPIVASPTPIPSPLTSPKTTPPPTLPKSAYTIVLFGDSMIDTMGENLEYLTKSLAAKYPKTSFNLYNFGIGSQNVKEGFERFNTPLKYKERNSPKVADLKPDIIILGSFSYNPFSPHDIQKHREYLNLLTQEAQKTNAKVFQLAEIAPIYNDFGKGPGGVNWPPADAQSQAGKIADQLESTVALAKSKNIPLINAFNASQTGGRYGTRIYVSTHDGIHPSVEGHVFMANLIANTLFSK